MLWTQLVHATALFAAGVAGQTMHTAAAAAAASAASASIQATRYLVLDTTLDVPSWTAVLMAMEASALPDSPIQLLGVLATESPEFGAFENLMKSTGMKDCLDLASCQEEELSPFDGAYTLQNAPEPVKKLLQWVDEHPRQITLYSSGALTTVAYAQAVDPTFPFKLGELVVVTKYSNTDEIHGGDELGFYDVSPYMKDEDAFTNVEGSGMFSKRNLKALEPTVSGIEIAARVRAAVVGHTQDLEGQRVKIASRPFAAAYLAGQESSETAGHDKATLFRMQDAAVAAIIYPELYKAAPSYWATQFDEDELWTRVVHVRSRDWTGFCNDKTGGTGFLRQVSAVTAAAALSQSTSDTVDRITNSDSTRYLVLDTTLDVPSWTAVLMAMEANASSNFPIQLLGVLATESSELGAFENLMENTGMMGCLDLARCEEEELYPLDGAYTLQNAPEPVRKLVQWVDQHPGQVTLYSSAALTTIAYAQAVDPRFASKVAELVIVARLDNTDKFIESGQVGFYDVSPFLKDQEAFIAILSGDIPLIRIMGPLEPVLSGPEIAARVRAAVVGETQDVDVQRAKLAQRPFASAYLAGHMSRMFAGHDKAILMQEPAMAAILYPDLIKAEPDVEFRSEGHDEDSDSDSDSKSSNDEESNNDNDSHSDTEASPQELKLYKLADKDITPGDRSTLIAQIDEDKFWEHLVRIRSRDWRGFCEQKGGVARRSRDIGVAHDEL